MSTKNQTNLTETLATTPFLNLYQTTFKRRSGTEGRWTWAGRPNDITAIFIAAIIQHKYILAIKEYRVPAGDYIWSIPAGLMLQDEDPLQAASRELHEETGLTLVKTCRGTSPVLLNAPGISDEKSYLVSCEAEGELSTNNLEDSEDITPYLFSREKLRAIMSKTKHPFDCRAYLVFTRFLDHGDL